MPLAALPFRHQMQQVHALVALPVLLALGTAELDLADGEQRLLGLRVHELHEACVEVDLRGERGDCDQAGPPDGQNRGDRLVEELRITVGRFL